MYRHRSSSSQSMQMCCFFTVSVSFHPKYHLPVPMPTVSGRLFRCTGMVSAEMCHRRGCRREGSSVRGGMPKRKERVGRRIVYKDELLGSRAQQLAHTCALCLQSELPDLRGHLIKQNPEGFVFQLPLIRTYSTFCLFSCITIVVKEEQQRFFTCLLLSSRSIPHSGLCSPWRPAWTPSLPICCL